MKKKVCLISQWPVHYHTPIFKELDKQDEIDFTVVYCDTITLNGYFCEETQQNVSWEDQDLLNGHNHIFLKNYQKHNNNKNFFLLINFSIIPHIFKQKYDVVIVRGYIGLTYLFAVMAAKISGAKLIFQGESTLRHNKGSIFKKICLNFFFSFFDLFFYSCEGNLQFLNKYAKHKKKLSTPCAVDNNFYRSKFLDLKNKREHLRKKLGISSDEIVLLSVGKLYDRKKPFDILKAVKKLNNNKLCILLVGDGILKDEIDDYAKKNHLKVILPGHKLSTQVAEYFSISDIYLQVSDYDPSPKSLNESMNFELPIVATKILGTCDDLVKENINGYKVNVGDIDDISNSIRKLKSKKMRNEMGKESHKIVSLNSIESHVKKMVNGIVDLFS